MKLKWIASLIATIILLIAAFSILSPLASPVQNIVYGYQDGSTQVLDHIEFDLIPKQDKITVVWIGDKQYPCDLYDYHAYCQIQLPVSEVRTMKIELRSK